MEKLPAASTELRISSIPPFFKCPRVRSCECKCIHEDSLLPIPPGGFNFPADGALVDGCLAVFPRLKGRKHSSLSFLSDYGVAFIINRCGVRLFMGHAGLFSQLVETLSSCFFFFSQSGFFKIAHACRTNADQACFCTSQLCLGETIIKFRNI